MFRSLWTICAVYPPKFPNAFLVIHPQFLTSLYIFAKCIHLLLFQKKSHFPLFSKMFLANHLRFLLSPIFWPRCIYASCFTRRHTGLLCRQLSSATQQHYRPCIRIRCNTCRAWTCLFLLSRASFSSKWLDSTLGHLACSPDPTLRMMKSKWT